MILQREYEVIRSSRKTLALQMDQNGRLVVRAPKRVSSQKIREFVESHWDWVEKKQRDLQQKTALPECTPEEEEFYRKQAARVLAKRTAYFAERMGISYGKITIRGQKTRWGSCSAKGNLNFNWRIVLAPEPVTDYVVIHELAHRIHMNHSAAFYQTIEAIMPDYRRQEQWLKENGDSLRYGRQSSAMRNS